MVLIFAPWLPIFIFALKDAWDMSLIYIRGEVLHAEGLNSIEVIFSNIVLNTIVFSPISYLLTISVLFPIMCLLHNRGNLKLSYSLTLGAGLGFIAPMVFGSVFWFFGKTVAFTEFVFPNFSNSDTVELYLITTISGLAIVFCAWYAGGITSKGNGRRKTAPLL